MAFQDISDITDAGEASEARPRPRFGSKSWKGGHVSAVLNCLQAFNLGTRSQIHVVQCLNSELGVSFGSDGYL